MRVVLDASAALEIVFERPFCELVLDTLMASETVLAPSLYRAEVGNALWKSVKVGESTLEMAQDYYDSAMRLVKEFADTKVLTPAAMRWACNLGHPIYDMYYLVLADRFDAHLVSLDKRLNQLAKEQGLYPVSFARYSGDKVW